MKIIPVPLAVLFLWLTACGNNHENLNRLTRTEKKEGWSMLFDGSSMDQWRTYLSDSLSGWTVENGSMKALGRGGDIGGDIVTRREYENFDLKLDWKISPGGNSGILFMVHEDTAFHAVYETGPEYQLIDDKGYPGPLEDWQLCAANYAMHPAGHKPLRPAGEWNTARIIKDGSHVEHWLNGVKVVEYELWTEDWETRVKAGKWKDYPGYGRFRKGHISLQDHGDEVWFRNIRIREL